MTCQASDGPVHERLRWQQNVANAQASTARAALCQNGQHLAFTVADDSTGLDRAAVIPIGTGLEGITDRLAALSGNIDITVGSRSGCCRFCGGSSVTACAVVMRQRCWTAIA
jgi:glucose-6-phosphate-specific signal transduction histidine kinase